MMRAAWLTDIHLNFLEDPEIARFLDSVLQEDPDAVLLGGDFGEADCLQPLLERMERYLQRPIYFVLGNHDYYGGSISSVRSAVRSLTDRSQHLVYLSAESFVSVTPKTALVGHDSWPDGRLGDYAGSSVELNDFYLIQDLMGCTKAGRLDD